MSTVFHCSAKQKIEIYKQFDVKEDDVKKQVLRLEEWIRAQPYLPEYPGDISMETVLCMNKFNVERTKQKITNYFVLRTVMPDLFKQNPNSPKILEAINSFYFVPVPNLTVDGNRVIVFQMKENQAKHFDSLSMFAYIISIYEIRMREECRYKDIHIYDMKNITLEHAIKFTPMMLKKLAMIFEKMYDGSVLTINFLHVPTYIESFLAVIRAILKTKIEQRIKVHKNIDSLYQFVPKENLPKDYGGFSESLEEISQLWKKKFLEYDETLRLWYTFNVNLNLLPEKLKMDDHFGVHGNFRKLDID